MPIVDIDNVGRVGIVTDIKPHELPPEAWTSGQNVRMRDNAVVKTLGYQAVMDPPTIAPYQLLPVGNDTSYFWLYMGLTKVYVYNGSAHTNITRQTASVDVNYAATADKGWNGGVLGGIPILNNGLDTPQAWDPQAIATKLAELANWPANTTAGVIRVFGNYLVALDVTVSSVRNPHLVRWSHLSDPGAVPTSWDFTDATVDAGRKELSDTAGFIVDCLPLGRVNILYKEDAVYTMQHIGGNFIFAFNLAFKEFGMLTKRCAREFFGKHLVVTIDDIVIHDGRSAKSILTKRYRKTLFNEINSTNYTRSFMVVHNNFHEMWFCYPTAGQSFATKALVWNWDDNTFSFRDLPSVAHIAPGFLDSSASDAWDSAIGVWNTDTVPWNQRLYSPTNNTLIMAGAANTKLYEADKTDQNAGSNMTAFIQREGLAVAGNDRHGNPKVDMTSRKFVSRIWPKLSSTGPLNVYVGGQENIGGAITWNGPHSFDPSVDDSIALEVNTPFIAVKFESTSDISWQLDGYKLDVQRAGRF